MLFNMAAGLDQGEGISKMLDDFQRIEQCGEALEPNWFVKG
jgi:hypothetical protein